MGFSKIWVHIEDNKRYIDAQKCYEIIFHWCLEGLLLFFSNIIIWTFTFKGGTVKGTVSTSTFIW